MKKISFKDNRVLKALSGKGFYVALCASILTVGAACFYAYNQTSNKLQNQLSGKEDKWGYEDVNKQQSGVPKESESDDPFTSGSMLDPLDSDSEGGNEQTTAEPMFLPVDGEILNEFSKGEMIKSETLGTWQTHNGIDFKATLGDSVKSISSGIVTEITEDPLWGVCVTIDHGSGYVAKYCSLSKGLNVKKDSSVSAGSVIGAIGDTADAEGAEVSHLHFELKKNGEYIDPMSVLTQ